MSEADGTAVVFVGTVWAVMAVAIGPMAYDSGASLPVSVLAGLVGPPVFAAAVAVVVFVLGTVGVAAIKQLVAWSEHNGHE